MEEEKHSVSMKLEIKSFVFCKEKYFQKVLVHVTIDNLTFYLPIFMVSDENQSTPQSI